MEYDFQSRLERVKAYRFGELRALMHQARADAVAGRGKAHADLAGALLSLHGVMDREFSLGELERDGSMTVGEYVADPDRVGADEAASAVNIAAQALVTLEKPI